MTEYKFPVCKAQRQFEDLCKSLIKIASDLKPEQLDDLHEYALQLYKERNDRIIKRWDNR